MQMRTPWLVFFVFLFLIVQVSPSCAETTKPNDFSRTLEPTIADSPDDFSFAVLTDRTAKERGEIFKRSIDKVNLLSPSFVINVGDIIEGYSGPDKVKAEWDETMEILSGLRMPFFYTAGNHDISTTDDLKEWRRRIGPTFYSFVFNKVLFVVLNSEGYKSVLSPGTKIDGYEILEKQNEWLEKILDQHKDVRWTFIFLHNPVWDYDNGVPSKWLRVEELLGNRPYTVFAGHLHEYTHEIRNNHDYISLATTGGWSLLKGIDHGQFDHVTYVTMKNDSPVIANLMLSGIQGKGVREKEWRDLIQKFDNNVVIHPVFDEGNTFSKGLTRFVVKNPSDKTVSIRTEVIARGGVAAEIKPSGVVLKPGTQQLFDLKMNTDRPLFNGGLKPITLTFINSIERPSGEIFDLKRKLAIFPQTKYHCPSPPENISIDGSLKEWGELPFSSVTGIPEKMMESAEPPLRFAIASNSEYLYIAGRILDDEPFFSKDKYNYEQDGMIIMLDARKDPERSKNRDGGDILTSGENQIVTLAGLVKSKVGHAFIGDLPENSIVKGIETNGGYSIEIAIPMKYLNTMQGGKCSAFRLNIGIADVDPSKSGSSIQSMWRPDRFMENALPGAGTFLLTESSRN